MGSSVTRLGSCSGRCSTEEMVRSLPGTSLIEAEIRDDEGAAAELLRLRDLASKTRSRASDASRANRAVSSLASRSSRSEEVVERGVSEDSTCSMVEKPGSSMMLDSICTTGAVGTMTSSEEIVTAWIPVDEIVSGVSELILAIYG